MARTVWWTIQLWPRHCLFKIGDATHIVCSVTPITGEAPSKKSGADTELLIHSGINESLTVSCFTAAPVAVLPRLRTGDINFRRRMCASVLSYVMLKPAQTGAPLEPLGGVLI